jgi:ribosomal protein S18 acetylase RimI-like enzyme
MSLINLSVATLVDLDQLALLFDAYRQSYGLPTDITTCAGYLQQRIQRGESTIILAAAEGDTAQGFCQLYPGFCSLAAAPILTLYDLYVVPAARGRGIGGALLRRAAEFGKQCGVARLDLATAKDNLTAQALYESHGWVRDEKFFTYSLALA